MAAQTEMVFLDNWDDKLLEYEALTKHHALSEEYYKSAYEARKAEVLAALDKEFETFTKNINSSAEIVENALLELAASCKHPRKYVTRHESHFGGSYYDKSYTDITLTCEICKAQNKSTVTGGYG